MTLGQQASAKNADAPLRYALLGDVCKTTSGGTPSRGNPAYFDGTIPWVKSGELPDGPVADIQETITEAALANSSAKLFPAGTLLIALYGATVGKLGILTRDAATNQAVCAVFPSSVLEQKYLFWFLRFKRRALIESAIGGAQPNISQGILRNLEVPLPTLDAQRIAVAEIEKQFSRLDEAVANLKRVKANLKRYKAAVLKAAVEGRLVPTEAELAHKKGRTYETGSELLKRTLDTRRKQWNGTGEFKEPSATEVSDLPMPPEGWAWVSAEQVCDPVASGSTPPPEKMNSGTGEVPFIKVYNLTFGDPLDFTIKPTFVERSTHNGPLARSRVLPGDVLMNIVGPPLGKVSVVDDSHPEWNINQAIVTFRPTDAIDGLLLSSWLLSNPILERLKKTSKATAGQSNLQVSTCRRIALPLPPAAEQKRIVARVERDMSLIRGVEAQADASLLRTEKLKRAVLTKAFRCG